MAELFKDEPEDDRPDEGPGDEDLRDLGEETSPCPKCGKAIYDDAERCPHCGQYVTKEDAKPARGGVWVLVVLAALAAATLWWLLRG